MAWMPMAASMMGKAGQAAGKDAIGPATSKAGDASVGFGSFGGLSFGSSGRSTMASGSGTTGIDPKWLIGGAVVGVLLVMLILRR